jgi:hypothetical protein
VVGYLTRPFLPRGFRCLGECCLCASNLGTAETETFSCFYFDCAHCCRCFCIYFVLCLRPRNPTVKTGLLQIIPSTLTASTLPSRSCQYLLPCRNLSGPLVRILLVIHGLVPRHYFLRCYLVRTIFLLVDLPAYDSRVQNFFLFKR